MNFHKIIIVIVAFLLLTACASMRQDSAPQHYVDVSKIKDAVPKVLPKSFYGNPKQYTVNGKTYHVLTTVRGYKAYGIASWYGTKFHAQRASDGEIYNMYKMTAAHKTLPIPCFVRVINLENGRTIIVKVIDRGPFAPHRIIDLSYVAAKKLGILAKGTGHVKVEAIDPILWARTHTLKSKNIMHHAHSKEMKTAQHIVSLPLKNDHGKGAHPKLSYQSKAQKYRQVGVYSSRYNAIVQKIKLESQTHQSVKIETIRRHRKTFYRVIVDDKDVL